MMIVGLFKIFISPSSLLFERFIVVSEQNVTHQKKQSDAETGFHQDIVNLRVAQSLRRLRAVFATILIWSTPSLFQYYLNRYYDPWAQNFYRLSCRLPRHRAIPDLPHPTRAPQLNWRAVVICFIPCLPNVIHQITQVMALFYMDQAFTRFSPGLVIFTALLALAFFPEERHVIRQWQFQLGTVLGLIGAFGVVWFQPGWKSGTHRAFLDYLSRLQPHSVGAIWHPRKTPFRGAWLDSQFRVNQPNHFSTVISAHPRVWEG